MVRVKLAYGRDGLEVDLPEKADVIRPPPRLHSSVADPPPTT